MFRAAMSSAGGVLIAASYVFPSIGPIVICAVVPLLIVLRPDSIRGALLTGWLAGILTTLGGFYWVLFVLAHLQNASLLGAAPLVAVFVLWQGLQVGLFAAGAVALLNLGRDHAAADHGFGLDFALVTASVWVLV